MTQPKQPMTAEEKYRIIADEAHDWEYWRNEDGQFEYVSPSCEVITGYPREAFIANPQLYIDILHPEDRERVRDHTEAISDAARQIEFRIIRKDGRETWIGHVCRPVFDAAGNYMGRRGSNRDITRNKRTEEALRESETRYRSLFDNNHAVILIIDPLEGRIVDANPAACAYYGYTREEITSLRITDINTLPLSRIRAQMRKAVSMRDRQFFFKHRLADGRIRDVEVFSGPIYIEGREFLYSIVHDVTERKKTKRPGPTPIYGEMDEAQRSLPPAERSAPKPIGRHTHDGTHTGTP